MRTSNNVDSFDLRYSSAMLIPSSICAPEEDDGVMTNFPNFDSRSPHRLPEHWSSSAVPQPLPLPSDDLPLPVEMDNRLLSEAVSTTKFSFYPMDNDLSTTIIDIVIEDARHKKKTVDSKMDSVMSLMREVELKEKAAEKAKQELDDCSLYINAEMDELIMAQQLAKEKNDKRAREVYTQKSNIATKMEELQSRILGVANEGDGCLATINEMRKSLEKRLTSAITKKEAADKEKLEKEVALAYQKSQMEKLVKESNTLEKEAWENFKWQEFLIDRGHVVNMLKEEVACKCQDVNLLKVELEDSHDANETSVTEEYLRPIIQDPIPTEDCEYYRCNNILIGVKKTSRTNKICKSRIINLKNKEMKKWMKGQITEALADHEEEYMV